MQYNDIMAMTTPYFSYVLTTNEPMFYYNFPPSSATSQQHICIFPEKYIEYLSITTSSYLHKTEDVFLTFTDITILPIDDKNNISLKDQQILRNKIEAFRIAYPELFI